MSLSAFTKLSQAALQGRRKWLVTVPQGFSRRNLRVVATCRPCTATNTNTIDVCACREDDKQAVQNSLVLEQATANAIWLIKRALSTFHYSQKARRDSWSDNAPSVDAVRFQRTQ
jgi:hypothetical protein